MGALLVTDSMTRSISSISSVGAGSGSGSGSIGVAGGVSIAERRRLATRKLRTLRAGSPGEDRTKNQIETATPSHNAAAIIPMVKPVIASIL